MAYMTDVLMEWGLLDVEREAQALVVQRRGGHRKRIGQVLVELGFCHRADVVNALAAQAGLRAVDLERVTPEPRAVAMVPREVALRHKVLPLRLGGPGGRMLGLAIAAPVSRAALEAARAVSGCELVPYIADDVVLEQTLARVYPKPVESLELPIVVGEVLREEPPAVKKKPERPTMNGLFISHRFDVK